MKNDRKQFIIEQIVTFIMIFLMLFINLMFPFETFTLRFHIISLVLPCFALFTFGILRRLGKWYKSEKNPPKWVRIISGVAVIIVLHLSLYGYINPIIGLLYPCADLVLTSIATYRMNFKNVNDDNS